MLSHIGLRAVEELGPWIWMLGGFVLVAIEIIYPRGFALSLGLAAIVTAVFAIFGESGVAPAFSFESQFGVWMLLSLALAGLIRARLKSE